MTFEQVIDKQNAEASLKHHLEQWELKLKNYVCKNQLEADYKHAYFTSDKQFAEITAKRGAFIFETTFVNSGELGNIFGFIYYHLMGRNTERPKEFKEMI